MKKIILWLIRAASTIAIIFGIACLGSISADRKFGIIFIIIGAIGVIATVKFKRKEEERIKKEKLKDNRCANCGHSMKGAQYRYTWDTWFFKKFKVVDEYDSADNVLPVTIYAICPKCGFEKVIHFKVQHLPLTFRNVHEDYYSDKGKLAYVQTAIRNHLDMIFED